METARQIIENDPYYLKERRKELQAYLDLFRNQLFKVVAIMPAPIRKIDLETGECEIINDEKWQAIIDQIKEEQIKFLKITFPEFYT